MTPCAAAPCSRAAIDYINHHGRRAFGLCAHHSALWPGALAEVRMDASASGIGNGEYRVRFRDE